MQGVQQASSAARTLLSARQVQDLLNVDRSTVYRMAEDGRLPSIKVGKQWRFPADAILSMISGEGFSTTPVDPQALAEQSAAPPEQRASSGPQPLDARVAQAAVDVAAPLLGVMMVVTDIEGAPITAIANPCPWFARHADDPEIVDACLAEWRDLAGVDDLQPKFGPSAAGFECARAFIRSGSSLIGMVLAGGVNPRGVPADGRYDLDADQRAHVLAALPRIAASLTRPAPQPLGAPRDPSLRSGRRSARAPQKENR